MRKACLMATILLILICLNAHARLRIDIGTGAVFSGYNDLRAPNISGTDVSLSEELKTDPNYFIKVRFTYTVDRHSIALFAAPVRLEANGEIGKPIVFEEEEFSADVPLKAIYQLNSYRLTYRYDFIRTPKLRAGLGLSARIEDGYITLESSEAESEKDNREFIPLINLRIHWLFSKRLSFLVEGDAFAISRGRTEDIFLAIQYKLDDNFSLKLGYRILEGGIDIDELYNFRLLNYVVIGPTVTF